MGLYESVLTVLLAVWLLICTIAQLGPIATRLLGYLQRSDLFGLIPRYHFFAPQPGTHDYHLLIRTRPLGTEFGAWWEVTPGEKRRWWNFAWNPDRRQRKQLSDLAKTLAKADAGCIDPATQLSIPYLLVLRYVTTTVGAAEGIQVQFLIARSPGFRSTQPGALFLSQAHRAGTTG